MPANGGANCTATPGCNVTTEGGILTETCVVTNCTPCNGGVEGGISVSAAELVSVSSNSSKYLVLVENDY